MRRKPLSCQELVELVTDYFEGALSRRDRKRFDGFSRGGKGYRAASEEIGNEIRRLWEWLRDLHEAGRPRDAVPPRSPERLRAPVTLP